MKKKVGTVIGIIVIVLAVGVFVLDITLSLVEHFTYESQPTLEEISTEFESYEKTNNTFVHVEGESLCFGYSEVFLGNLVDNGHPTSDWFVAGDKLYFSYYEWDENSKPYYAIYECDFYGKNVKQLYSFKINRTESFVAYSYIETFDNAFYIADGSKITAVYPLEDRQEEIAYSGTAYNYVGQLEKEQARYTVIKEEEKEVIIRDEVTKKEYAINSQTFKNSEEGKSLLKFKKYELGATVSDNRILITARVVAKNTSDVAYVTFEYDAANNKLVFQNCCQTFNDSFETYSY